MASHSLCVPSILSGDRPIASYGGLLPLTPRPLLPPWSRTTRPAVPPCFSEGTAGLYRGFVPSVIDIVSMICSVSVHEFLTLPSILTHLIEPVVPAAPLEGSFLASFGLVWDVTIGAGLASYPLDAIRRCTMMTSGGTVHYQSRLDTYRI